MCLINRLDGTSQIIYWGKKYKTLCNLTKDYSRQTHIAK